MAWFYSFLGLSGLSAAIWFYLKIQKSGEDRQKAKHANEEIERAKFIQEMAEDTAKGFANTPVTAHTAAQRLYERAAAKLKRKT